MSTLKNRVDQLCGDRSALPKNQERLVFDEPWQGRAFGLALALAEQGAYQWDEFRASLISNIGALLPALAGLAGKTGDGQSTRHSRIPQRSYARVP